MNLLLHWIGITNPSGKVYLFWSGFFADATIFAAGFGLYRKHNCHARGCWRLGKHPVEGTPYTTCRLHHPIVTNRAVPVAMIHAAHRAAHMPPTARQPERRTHD